MPFLALFYADLGFGGRQIGVLRGIAPIVTLLSAPLWSALADATGRHSRIRALAVAATWGAILALSLSHRYGLLLGLVALQAFFGAPVIPLTDSAVLGLLGPRRADYGAQRLWGAVGWGAAGLVAGSVIERFGLRWGFVGYLVLMGGAAFVTLSIPDAAPPVRDPAGDAPKPAPGRFRRDLRRLLADRAWLLFLVAVLIGGLYQAFEVNYLMLYLRDLGVSEALMGLALLVGTVGEIPVWALAPRWLLRWGPRSLLSAAFVAAALKGLVYGLQPPAWLAVGVQLLHGFAFPAMWAAGVAYASDAAPEGTQATAQGLFGGVFSGLCATLGAFVGGQLYAQFGGPETFRLAALAPVIALGVLWLGTRSLKRRESRAASSG